ncbi:NAD(P)-binding protein [Thozetella sp. PMI_491]|nr:NAD(P)-binding protein [Thozetella sp. PMI_491]
MSKPWIFICPASRGIGYHLTRHLYRHTNVPILATARSRPSDVKARLLEGLGTDTKSSHRLHVIQMDVTDESTIKAASTLAAELFPPKEYHLHMAFAIPGILHPEKSPRQVDADAASMTYRVNTLGPLLLMKWFSDFMPRRSTQIIANEPAEQGRPEDKILLPPYAVWTTMSARVGSISDNRSGGWFSYRSSKAAVNSLTKSLDHHLHMRSGDRAMAIAYHPGTVKTDFTRNYWKSTPEDKLLCPEYAANAMIDAVTGQVGLEGRGRCWDYKGVEVLP